jgi:hypothetical protein
MLVKKLHEGSSVVQRKALVIVLKVFVHKGECLVSGRKRHKLVRRWLEDSLEHFWLPMYKMGVIDNSRTCNESEGIAVEFLV